MYSDNFDPNQQGMCPYWQFAQEFQKMGMPFMEEYYPYEDYERPDGGFPPGGNPSGFPPMGGFPPFGGFPPAGGLSPFGGQQGQEQYGPPTTPPPSFVPQQQAAAQAGGPSIYAVDPGAIRPCLFRFVYLWLRNGRNFWAYLVFAGPRSVAGYRWNGRRWVYFGVDLRQIVSFVCR